MTNEHSDRGAFAAAMDTLRSHHEEARAELLTGFETRQDILLWQHRCAALTIGRLPDSWFATVFNDRWLTAALLDSEAMRVGLCATDTAPDDELCLSLRYDIIQDDLTPAFQRALSVARRLAVDYAGADHRPVGDRQQYIFMRPQLDDLVETQREMLLWALGRVDDLDQEAITGRAGVLEWAKEVVYATNAFIDPAFARTIAHPNSEWWTPLTESRGPSLERLLAEYVLPRCNRALRDASERAKEQLAEERQTEPRGVPHG